MIHEKYRYSNTEEIVYHLKKFRNVKEDWQVDFFDEYGRHMLTFENDEETMEALYDMVKIGIVKQIGASDMYAYQFMKAQETARLHHWKTFVSMQSQYNVMYREDERELLKLLKEENVSMTPCVSLIAEKIAEFEKNKELGSEMATERKVDEDYPILMRIYELAKKHDVTMLQIALAWSFAKEGVAVPVIGIKSTSDLEEAAASVAIKLSPEEMRYLEEPYVPHKMLEVV